MKRYISFTLSSFLMICALLNSVVAQTSVDQLQPLIELKNGSFEDDPHVGKRLGRGPNGWRDCGKMGETSPDIHPSPSPDSAFFEVTMGPSDGSTYLGMVVRDNITWESVGQRLRTPMLAGNCYNFSIDLARSKRYVSPSKSSSVNVNYKKAAVLRVWGSNSPCGKLELLDETAAVENHDWRTYNMRLEPSRNYSFIMLEAFYKTPVFTEYNGNMLLDNASNLIPVPCDKAPEPAMEEPKDDLVVSTTPKDNSPNNPKKDPKTEDKPETKSSSPSKPQAGGKPVKKKKEYIKELDNELAVGQEITLKNLYFDADSFSLNNRFYPIVDDVYAFLEENEKVVIEVGGHTNNRCEDPFCNGLSEARAKSVANYLIHKGINSQRVAYKGYGKTSPKYPNNTPTNRRRNQRVDIKILSKG